MTMTTMIPKCPAEMNEVTVDVEAAGPMAPNKGNLRVRHTCMVDPARST